MRPQTLDIFTPERTFGRLLLAACSASARCVSRVEGKLFGDDPPKYPPVFVVGLPRAGTTLIYQTLCHCFNFSYLPTISNYLVAGSSMVLRSCLSKTIDYRSDFRSSYGLSNGIFSPGEGGGLWNLWFKKDRFYDSQNALDRESSREIVRLIGRVERIAGRPFINKNLRHNCRIRLLAELFPRALFVVVSRNPRHVAVSLLKAGLESGGGHWRWFSVKPRNYDILRHLSPGKSIVGQIKGILEDIRRDMVKIGCHRFFKIRYEKFCELPSAHLRKFSDFARANGLSLAQRREPPPKFTIRIPETADFSGPHGRDLRNALDQMFPQGLPSRREDPGIGLDG
jgi:hypothetical protein